MTQGHDDIQSVQALIEKWESKAAFARAIGAPEAHGRVIHRRNRIPASYHQATIKAAGEIGIELTAERLTELNRAGFKQGY